MDPDDPNQVIYFHETRINALYNKMFKIAIDDPLIILTPEMLSQTRQPFLEAVEKNGGILTGENDRAILKAWQENILAPDSNVDPMVKASVKKSIDQHHIQEGLTKPSMVERTAYDIYKEMVSTKYPNAEQNFEEPQNIVPGKDFDKATELATKHFKDNEITINSKQIEKTAINANARPDSIEEIPKLMKNHKSVKSKETVHMGPHTNEIIQKALEEKKNQFSGTEFQKPLTVKSHYRNWEKGIDNKWRLPIPEQAKSV